MHKSRNSDLQPAGMDKDSLGVSNEWFPIFLCSAINIALLAFVLKAYENRQFQLDVFGLAIDFYIFSGFAVQAQILVNTYLSIRTMKKGFIAVILLNALGICFSGIGGVLVAGGITALPGMVTYFSSISRQSSIIIKRPERHPEAYRARDEITSLYRR